MTTSRHYAVTGDGRIVRTIGNVRVHRPVVTHEALPAVAVRHRIPLSDGTWGHLGASWRRFYAWNVRPSLVDVYKAALVPRQKRQPAQVGVDFGRA